MSLIIRSLLLIMTLACTQVVRAQEESELLLHEMSAAEKARLHEVGARFVQTPPPAGDIRGIAEFEPMEGVLIRYPFGIPYPLIAEMSQDCKVYTIVSSTSQQNTVTNNYTTNGVNLANCEWVIAPSNSYWTRDYGPWFIHFGDKGTGIIDFPYNRPRPLDDSIPKSVAAMLNIPWFGMNLIHTGGNYMTTGRGHATSTDLVQVENPTLSPAQISQMVQDYMGLNLYDLVPDPNNTYIDHIDCWGKFLAPDKVLIRSVPTTHAQYNDIETTAAYFAAQISPYGTPFKVFRVYTPNNQPYTNSLILNKKVLVPIMNQLQYDTAALHAYQVAMPGYEIIGFTGLSGSSNWASTDALHCRTIGLADRGMLEILHNPLLGSQALLSQYILEATITPYSGFGLYPDSVLLYYKYNNGNYVPVIMTATGTNLYEAIIPGPAAGTLVSYYLQAADSSGRRENHPYTGIADPHVFEAGSVGITSHANTDPAYAVTASPNPFRHHTTLEFHLEKVVPCVLSIHDVQGRKVSTLVDQPLGAGKHFFTWDGRDLHGNSLPPGIYLALLNLDGVNHALKLVRQDN